MCYKVFSTSSYLAGHQRRVHGKQYVCNVCENVYDNYQSLITHKRSHVCAKSYVCNMCRPSTVYDDYRSLRLHRRRYHKRYTCSVCNKAFRKYKALDRHKRTHFYCVSCNTAFGQVKELEVHECIGTVEKAWDWCKCRYVMAIRVCCIYCGHDIVTFNCSQLLPYIYDELLVLMAMSRDICCLSI